MPTLKALDLERRADPIGAPPICVLVGDDDSMRTRCLRLLTEAAAPPDQPGSTVRSFDDAAEARDVFDELRTVPFMGLEGRRVAVVEKGDAFLAAHWERLHSFVRSAPDTSTLILCLAQLNSKSPPGRAPGDADEAAERRKSWRAFIKALGTAGLIVDCSRPSWGDAKGWVRAEAQRMGRKLASGAVDSLVEAVGPNLMALRNELDKLCAYAGDRATITERDVGELVPAARSRSVFDLAEAVGSGDAAAALRLCARLLLGGESREGIISVLGLQLRRLWQMKRLHAAGTPAAQIARELGVPAFAVRRAARTLPALNEAGLARQLGILAAADVESKTTSLRAQEERVWLEGLLARLCRKGGGRSQ